MEQRQALRAEAPIEATRNLVHPHQVAIADVYSRPGHVQSRPRQQIASLESTVRYLGIDEDDTLEISEQIEI